MRSLPRMFVGNKCDSCLRCACANEMREQSKHGNVICTLYKLFYSHRKLSLNTIKALYKRLLPVITLEFQD